MWVCSHREQENCDKLTQDVINLFVPLNERIFSLIFCDAQCKFIGSLCVFCLDRKSGSGVRGIN